MANFQASDELNHGPFDSESGPSDNTLDKFKKLVRKAIFLSPDESTYFTAIPDEKWRKIFEVNFNGNYAYASRVILKKFRDIKSTDMPRVEAEKGKIHNLEKASKMLNAAIDSGEPVFFITDIDNDGSFSQAIIHEFLKADPSAAKNSHVEYTQTVNGNAARGFTVDHLDKLVQMKGVDTDAPFLVVTADNGINSRDEQVKIQARFPTCKLIVTDHHLPDPGMVVKEDANTLIFNPHYKPSEFYEKFNISGAATVGVLLRRVLDKRLSADQLEKTEKNLENITTLSRVANLLDYVHTDPMDKPEKDYVVTKFLQLQGLMNVNNSLCKIILDGIPETVISQLKIQIPDLDDAKIRAEAENIETKNYVARILLKIHAQHKNADLPAAEFGRILVSEMARPENFDDIELEVNRNFIEQLRPPIFSLSVDEEKSAFMEKVCAAMVDCYESIRDSEKKIAEQLRKGQAMQRESLPNSAIVHADPAIVKTFNRKLLGKVYNDENPGFLAIMDSGGRAKWSGSMRSMYDISEILTAQDRSNLEFELGVRIHTPGHERAAGFIIESHNPETDPVTQDKIQKINEFIDSKIAALRAADSVNGDTHLLTDLSAIGLIDRINQVIRGSISNFERIVPLLKLTPDTIWTESYSTKQFTMADIAKAKKFGYISINTDFHGGTVIVPVELIRRVVQNNYQDYLAINYMDGGVFMAERVVSPAQAPVVKDLRGANAKAALIDEVFSKDFKTGHVVSLNRDQIKDNPFFKYNDFGKSDFNLFERMVIGIIDSTRVKGDPIDTLAVFDVEANGFGNGKLMNFGAMNYSIDPLVSKTATVADFQERLFQNQRGREFLLTPEQMGALIPVKAEDKPNMPLERRKMLLMKRFAAPGANLTYDVYYDYPDSARDDKATPGLGPIAYVNNHAVINGSVVYNREIRAEMIAYLIKDDDFKVPQEMTNLTGITQAHLDKHGIITQVADAGLADYYKGKKVLFGAHNTPYDARILRANTPRTYEVLLNNGIYDSALFCKEDKLAYDDVKVTSFHGINGIPNNVHFYDNPHSDFSLTDFLADETRDGYYPDRTGNYLLGREHGEYYFVDKIKHEIIKLNLQEQAKNESEMAKSASAPQADLSAEPDELAGSTAIGMLISHQRPDQSIPNISVKYSVEKLSEQWMTHALLLSEEPFDIAHVDLADPQFEALRPFKSQLIFFQDNYLFDASPESNIDHFCAAAFIGVKDAPAKEDLESFLKVFLDKNKDIQQKFTDSWMYKSVLGVMEPKSNADLNNDNDSLIHFQTQVPKLKIREIFREAVRFKAKYGVDHILQHEGHVNGPWEGDHKGDVAFEDKLTLALLARRMYNPYSRDISAAIDRFGVAARKAKLAFDLSHNLSDGAAHDSYSYRQGLLYKRAATSSMISGIQVKEAKLADENAVHVIKLKLETDLLPDETSVSAIVRKGVSLSREDIMRDAKMLDFIILNEQTRSSIDNVDDQKSREEVQMLLEANDKISLKYKEELSERYRFVEISRRDLQLKKLLSTCLDIIEGNPPKRMPKPETVCDLSALDLDIIERIMMNQAGMSPSGLVDQGNLDAAKGLLEIIREKRAPSKLEAALARDESDGFKTFQTTRDPNFLERVEISRRDPIHTLLFKHPQLRMANALLDERIKQAKADAQPESSNLSKPKRARKIA